MKLSLTLRTGINIVQKTTIGSIQENTSVYVAGLPLDIVEKDLGKKWITLMTSTLPSSLPLFLFSSFVQLHLTLLQQNCYIFILPLQLQRFFLLDMDESRR